MGCENNNHTLKIYKKKIMCQEMMLAGDGVVL